MSFYKFAFSYSSLAYSIDEGLGGGTACEFPHRANLGIFFKQNILVSSYSCLLTSYLFFHSLMRVGEAVYYFSLKISSNTIVLIVISNQTYMGYIQ